MQLSHLLQNVEVLSTKGPQTVEVSDFQFDSRQVQQGELYVALRGMRVDGHTFIESAIGNGAHAIVCETLPDQLESTVTYVQVASSSAALSLIAANYWGRPAEKLKVIGITGTNGKTSTVTLLHQLFNQLGYMSGMVSTVRNAIGLRTSPSSFTTPYPKQLHQLFAEMVEEGCEYCFMEVSSHGLALQRVYGIPYRVGVFTNLTHDHIDFHGSFAEYIKAKKLLFDMLDKDALALVNIDDKHGRVMTQNTAAPVKTMAIKAMADFKGRLLENTFEGLQLEIDGREAWFQVLGGFNAYNLLTVYAVAVSLGLDKEEVLLEMTKLGGVEGRFQPVKIMPNGPTAIVDYAHTPDALKNVLKTIQSVNQQSQQGRIITVVGCGGNRDKGKRPDMAAIAAQMSDQAILTSDNPRDEAPEAILEHMETGISPDMAHKVLTIVDRKQAIRTAARLSQPQDVILIAGKGHETYQEIKGKRYPFDDRVVIQEAFKNNG